MLSGEDEMMNVATQQAANCLAEKTHANMVQLHNNWKKIPTHIAYACMRRSGLLRDEPLTRAHTLISCWYQEILATQ